MARARHRPRHGAKYLAGLRLFVRAQVTQGLGTEGDPDFDAELARDPGLKAALDGERLKDGEAG